MTMEGTPASMPKTNPFALAAALLVAVVTLGCNDSTTEPAAALDLVETEALFLGIFAFATNEDPEIVSETPGGALYACPLGGQVSVAFDFTEESVGDTVRIITDMTLDPQRCVVQSEGYRFTLDGNPSVHIEMTLSSVGALEQLTLDGTVTGGVDWELEDRSGTCMIDVSFNANIDFSVSEPGDSGTISGTMCGMEVEFDGSGIGPSAVGS